MNLKEKSPNLFGDIFISSNKKTGGIVKYILLIILICFTVHLFSQVNFEYIFNIEDPTPDDYLHNIWIDDLDNNGVDEMYVLYINYSEDNWKLYCLDFSGTVLWNYTYDYPNNFIPFKNGLLFNYNDSLYLATVLIRYEEQAPYVSDVYSDLKIYEWDNYTLIDSSSIFIGTCMDEEGYGFDVNQINPIVLNNSLNLYIGEKITHSWGSWEEGYHTTKSNKINRFSFDNNTLVFEETIANAGSILLHYNDFNSLISFCKNSWSYCDNMGNQSMGSSEYLKTLSFDIPSQIYDIRYSTNSTLKLLTENDLNYSDYGLSVLLSNSDYWFQSYSPDFSDTLWISQQLGIMEEGYYLTVSTCVSTNLGENYILYFGENYDQPDLPKLEIRDRLTGQIVLTQQSDIHPDFILRANDNSLYFIEGGGNPSNPEYYNVYQLENEIQVSCENNIIAEPISKLCNHPNPFNPTTTIEFSIQNDSQIELSVFNIKGQKIKTLANNEFTKGSHSIIWNGDDESNKPVSSCVYLYNLKVNGKIEAVKKCLLLK